MNKAFNKKHFKKWVYLFIGISETLMMFIIYFAWSIFPDMIIIMNLSQGQLLKISSISGLTALISYLIGAILVDKFNNKKLLLWGMFLVGISTIIWMLLPMWGGYDLDQNGTNDSSLYLGSYYLIYILISFFGTGLYWCPLWKYLSTFTENDNYGYIHGRQQTIYGFFSFFCLYLFGLFFVTIIADKIGSKNAFYLYFTYVAFITFFTAIMIWWLLDEIPIKKKRYQKTSSKITNLFKNYRFWLLMIFEIGLYTLEISIAKTVVYLNESLLIKFWIVSLFSAISVYLVRATLMIPIGKIVDKRKSYINVLLLVLLIGIGIFSLMIFLPGFNNNFENLSDGYQRFVHWVGLFSLVLIGILTWTALSLYYPVSREIGVKGDDYKVFVGVASTFIFSGEFWINFICGVISDNHLKDDGSGFTTQAGNQMIIGVLLIVAFVGFLSGISLKLFLKFENKTKKSKI